MGAGVAGLRAAIELAPAGKVLVVAKDTLRESSSEYAQGGIAAALGEDDEVSLHEQDTLAAGDGLCDPIAVRTLVGEGPAVIEELLEWGAEFDREGTRLVFAREGAHSRSRVLHAHGDSTGAEIARTLYCKASSLASIEFRSFSAITDLLLASGEVLASTGASLEFSSAHNHRGIIEGSNPRKWSVQILEHQPRQIPNPLAQQATTHGSQRTFHPRCFRRQPAAAPLKPAHGPVPIPLGHGFRRQPAAAPLKLDGAEQGAGVDCVSAANQRRPH